MNILNHDPITLIVIFALIVVILYGTTCLILFLKTIYDFYIVTNKYQYQLSELKTFKRTRNEAVLFSILALFGIIFTAYTLSTILT